MLNPARLLLLAATGLGTSAVADPGDFDGFGLRVFAGAAMVASNREVSGEPDATATDSRLWGLAVSYAEEIAPDWYLGGEFGVQQMLMVDDEAFDGKNVFAADETEIFSMRATLGRRFEEKFLAYGAVGYEYWNLAYFENDTDTIRYEDISGLSLGFGTEYLVRPQHAVGFEIKHSWFSRSPEYGMFDPVSVAPENTQIAVGYRYRF